MVRRRPRESRFVMPDWVASFTPDPTSAQPIQEQAQAWRGSVREFCKEHALQRQDIQAWLWVVSNTHRVKASLWQAPKAYRDE